MTRDIIATATVDIDAPISAVWHALTDPAAVKQYFFDTDLSTDWQPGSQMTFRGTWKGTAYEDLGTVLEFEPLRHLAYSHWSPLSGQPDTPEYRHILDITLAEHGGRTSVTLQQDNNASDEEREHAAESWAQVLAGLKQYVEGNAARSR